MHPSVEAFALATGLLALGAALVHRFGFPPLPVYLLTGLLLGQALPVQALEPLPSLGLLLLLFSVGLEFGPDRLKGLPGKTLQAGFYDALALPLGFILGILAGLDLRGAALLAGAIYVSSSAVIVKLIIDLRRAANPESEVVLGVSVLEDLVVLVLLALLGGQGLQGFLLSLLLAGLYLGLARFLGPLLVRFMEGLSDELVLLLGAAFTTGTALLFQAAGASVGLGAFLAGSLAASLGLRERFERLFGPVRDLGVALFFLVVGASARDLFQGLTPAVAALALLGLLLKLPLNYLGGSRAGLSRKRRLYSAFYLVPRGEFNLVLGALAQAQGYPLVAQVAVLLVLLSIPLGALLIRFAPELGRVLMGEPRRQGRSARSA
ncbi:MAG: cation:proton antiporter [Thermus sp.]|nr:cation:proton antiporter [Thermus sp.]